MRIIQSLARKVRGPARTLAIALMFFSPDSPAGEATFTGPLAELEPYRERSIQDDIMYFLVTDRFNNADPSNDRGGFEGGPPQAARDHRHHAGVEAAGLGAGQPGSRWVTGHQRDSQRSRRPG